MIRDLIMANRSFRRFKQSEAIDRKTLEELIDLARCSASSANLQPLKYIIANTPERNALVFATLSWAGYLKDWDGPAEGERPSAYVIVLGDTQVNKSFNCDHGIAAQSILLGAAEKGLGGCMIGSIARDRLRRSLSDLPGLLRKRSTGRPARHGGREAVEIRQPAFKCLRFAGVGILGRGRPLGADVPKGGF